MTRNKVLQLAAHDHLNSKHLQALVTLPPLLTVCLILILYMSPHFQRIVIPCLRAWKRSGFTEWGHIVTCSEGNQGNLQGKILRKAPAQSSSFSPAQKGLRGAHSPSILPFFCQNIFQISNHCGTPLIQGCTHLDSHTILSLVSEVCRASEAPSKCPGESLAKNPIIQKKKKRTHNSALKTEIGCVTLNG